MINELSVGAFPDVLYEEYQYSMYLTLLQVLIYFVRIIVLMKSVYRERFIGNIGNI